MFPVRRIECALCPTAKRACDRAWVTAKNLEEWSSMSTTTLWIWLEKIEKARRIPLVSDMILVDVSTSTGAVKTTFYNLNVLNQLAMACIEHSNVSKMCELCRDKDKVVVRPSDLTSNDLLDVKNREYTLISEYSDDLSEYSESRGNPTLTVISEYSAESADIPSPLRNQGVFFFSLHGAVFDTPPNMCYKSQLSRGTRGQKTERPQNFKKVERTP